ncbi:hypothetical protein ASPZODRAFT_25560 [Penicilliopsis zonata CBS 506.65]|uniref:Uncharacterized protein n=1 Tax=Penicilliopsis zonata CBS 506.65 TaxID=1073090 RepID=A0A1L9SGY8_9EURO|nr:hypothetical protein ASPZODRAFT_25560 [Penicilliopsis zonata CBS 506.65]OJJ46452.1 hypothetical protein ASPZODRAFT_25560 [Penicilliopsis zonata CBS 506.65]
MFTPAQLDAYLEYIDIPLEFRRRTADGQDEWPPRDLSFLTALHTHHISAIPYENLALHYSINKRISLDAQHLLRKCTRNGRGGYCMETTLLFTDILRSLGFTVYPTGARIRYRVDGVPQGDYSGWVHVVNIVSLPCGRYVVDSGFGGDGPIAPLPLTPGVVTANIGTQEIRLAHDYLPGQISQTESQKNWIYQYRNSTEQEWNSFYAFTETEFQRADFEVMNFFTSQSPDSFQRFTVLVVRFLRRGQEIYGKRMLVNGDVKENLGGKTQLVRRCQSEEERVASLSADFVVIRYLQLIATVGGLDVSPGLSLFDSLGERQRHPSTVIGVVVGAAISTLTAGLDTVLIPGLITAINAGLNIAAGVVTNIAVEAVKGLIEGKTPT